MSNIIVQRQFIFHLIIICAILLLMILFCYLNYNKNKNQNINTENYVNLIKKNTFINSSEDNNIIDINTNKIYLFSYWEKINGATKIPEYIDLCFDTIKKNSNEHFNFILLNEKTIFDYIPDLRKDINELPIALKTDYIRVKLLYLYGGFWIDADTIMMNNFDKLYQKLTNDKYDFIGFGCTGAVCKKNAGYGRPSNGVMGSIKEGKMISLCLKKLNDKLDKYFAIPKTNRKSFDYFDLGKKIIWESYDTIMANDKQYVYYHIDSEYDGTRDENGKWIVPQLIFKNEIKYADINNLYVVMLANSWFCGDNKEYNWFCKLTKNDILTGNYMISKLFNLALKK